MRLSISDWASKMILVGFGFLLGGQFHSFFEDERTPVQTNANISWQDIDSRILMAINQQEAKLRSAVSAEISQQFALIDTVKLNKVGGELVAKSAPETKPSSQELEASYNSANNRLTDVLASGGFSPESAEGFLNDLKNLPADKQLELRAKHMDAFNRGLISSPLPPEVILAQMRAKE